MKREKLDFWRYAPQLRDLFFHADIYGPRQILTPALAWAVEISYYVGCLDCLGLAMGYPGDDIRGRCLALQRQASERLAELREMSHAYCPDGITNFDHANHTVKRRNGQRDKRFR
jgi:hypothetical protein